MDRKAVPSIFSGYRSEGIRNHATVAEAIPVFQLTKSPLARVNSQDVLTAYYGVADFVVYAGVSIYSLDGENLGILEQNLTHRVCRKKPISLQR